MVPPAKPLALVANALMERRYCVGTGTIWLQTLPAGPVS
jgi:hypothetical protein